MNKKNKILKLFSFIVVAFVLLLSVFAFIPQKENNVNCASAVSDSTIDNYRFDGSNVFIPVFVPSTSNINDKYPAWVELKISLYTGVVNEYLYNTDPTYFFVTANRFTGESNRVYPIVSCSFNRIRFSGTTYTAISSISSSNWIGDENVEISHKTALSDTYNLTIPNNTYSITFGVSLNSKDFVSNIVGVTMGVRSSSLVLPSTTFSHNIFYIRYFDVNQNYIDFEFYCQSDLVYETRSYLFSNSLTDNQIYNEGYNAGLSANQDTIYNQGFNAGKIDGYNQGFDAGVGSANDYTFNGLFSAVIDAPLQAFSGLFNFELLGVNLLGFITGLLTLIVVIYIIRICLGG